jgi:hypothetical protein
MHDPAAKTGLAREVLGEMDRIVVARKLGEADHVFVPDRLADRRPHTDRKILEMERLKQGVLHAANKTFNGWRSIRRRSVDERQIEPGVKTVYGSSVGIAAIGHNP